MICGSYIWEWDIGLLIWENGDVEAVSGIQGCGGVFIRRITIRRNRVRLRYIHKVKVETWIRNVSSCA